MSTTAVSSSSIYQELQAYFQQRSGEVAQLGQDLTSGNLTNAQQDFATLQSLGQGGPFANGDVFSPSNQREQDFTAIGQALQSGNLIRGATGIRSTRKHIQEWRFGIRLRLGCIRGFHRSLNASFDLRVLLPQPRRHRFTSSCSNTGSNVKPTLLNLEKTWHREIPRMLYRTLMRWWRSGRMGRSRAGTLSAIASASRTLTPLGRRCSRAI